MKKMKMPKYVLIFLVAVPTFFARAESEIKIEKTDKPYTDYNTGEQRTRTDFKLKLDKHSLSLDAIKDLVNSKHPGLLTFPTIYDSVQMAPDDLLIVVTRDSQGPPYPIVRVQLKRKKLQAELVDVGAVGSPNNWFPDSRLEGWTRAIGANDESYMIRWSPFKVVKMGAGQLAKMTYPYAFLVQDWKMKRARVFDLERSVEVAHLDLDEACFKLPAFNFDHPKLDRSDTSRDDSTVSYNYGPDWWDKNFEFTPTPQPTLKLKQAHVLAAPEKKLLAVIDPAREQAGPIDLLPMNVKDCSAVNPRGTEMAKSLAPVEESILASDLCTTSFDGIDAGLKKRVCGKPEIKKVFSKYDVHINEETYTYRPFESARPSVSINAIEMIVKDKSFFYLSGENASELEGIKKLKVLNDDQVLLQARNSGPWNIYVVTANLSKQGFDLQKIGSFGYPGTDFEDLDDGHFLYTRQGRMLVEKKPFNYLMVSPGVIAVQNQRLFSFYEEGNYPNEKGAVIFVAWNIAGIKDPYGLSDHVIFDGKISRPCLSKMGFPNVDASIKEKESWFKKNLKWSESEKVLKSTVCKFEKK